MRESLASTAQYTLNGSADATGLVSLRARVKTRMADGLRDITIGDLVTFCTVKALLDAPHLNAEYIDGRIVQHAHVHLGVRGRHAARAGRAGGAERSGCSRWWSCPRS